MIEYRKLRENEIRIELFEKFVRHQVVTDCLRKENDEWVIRSAPFIDDWSEKDYTFLVSCLKNTVATGGLVYGAFYNGSLKGFVSVESKLFGGEQKYLDLSQHSCVRRYAGAGNRQVSFSLCKSMGERKGG